MPHIVLFIVKLTVEIKSEPVYYVCRTEKLEIFYNNKEELKISVMKFESLPTLYFIRDLHIIIILIISGIL